MPDFIFLGFPTVYFFSGSLNLLHRPQTQPQTQTNTNPRRLKKIITGADLKPKHDRSKPQPRPNHDLKPTGANPFKKSHHRSHLSHNPTTTNDPLQPPIRNQRPPSVTDPRPTTRFIPARRSTTTTQPRRSTTHNPQPRQSTTHNPQPTTHNHADPQPTTTPIHNHH